MNETLIAEFFPDMEPVNTILEIGSHQMQDTAWMRERWPAAKIICIEPDRRSVDFVVRRGLVERLGVTLLPFAATKDVGLFDFYESTNGASDPDQEWAQSSSLHRPHEMGPKRPESPCCFERSVKVVGLPLDAIIPMNCAAVDLLWMDVQASELDVIQGATETLKRTRFMLAEHNTAGVYENEPGIDRIIAALPDWEVLKVFPYDVFLRHK